MRAMLLDAPGRPLRPADLPVPEPTPDQVLLRVQACGVCRTDLHLADGEIEAGHLPLVLGHQVVGTIVETGERIGVPWLAWTCGECRWCRSGRENLCPRALFTGRDLDGGYAEYLVAYRDYCLALPDMPDLSVAPLLCAGLIGNRALRLTGAAERLGLYGFGSSAHIVAQVARHQGRRVFAFSRPGDEDAQRLALRLGAEWAGDSTQRPPEELDGAIIFAPVGALVTTALKALARGGTVVCAGIHMSDIPSFPYDDLWLERSIRSVANLTRADAVELLELAPCVPIVTEVHTLPLEEADRALAMLRAGRVTGSLVLDVATGSDNT